MTDCSNFENNMNECSCSYGSCSRQGKCCECIRHHKNNNELPACYFPPEVESTFDRSISRFVSLYK